LHHLVFERGKIGESWRTQRWHSFVLNTANANNVLPGDYYKGDDADGFSTAAEFVDSLQTYAHKFQLPVVEQAEVILIDKEKREPKFTVFVLENGAIKNYQCRQVIICSGCQNKKKVPAFAENIAPYIIQLHASEYRTPAQLGEGAVLVVGSAQSGCQVAEDLADSGKKVYLSTSMVARLPRRYRGKDIMHWLNAMRFFDMRPEDIQDPAMMHTPAPQLTGKDGGSRTISLQALAQKGVSIIGKMKAADDMNVFFETNAAAHVQFADGFSKQVKDMIDGFILQGKLTAPVAEEEMADMPDTDALCVSNIASLNLKERNISTIIYTTGFTAAFNYIKLPVLDEEGNPMHKQGITGVDGLYFLGMPWLRTRKSGIIFGIKEDAEFITDMVYKYALQKFADKTLVSQ
jgi:putative flavoprotein involved in K+ transport